MNKSPKVANKISTALKPSVKRYRSASRSLFLSTWDSGFPGGTGSVELKKRKSGGFIVVVQHDGNPHLNSSSKPYSSFNEALEENQDDLLSVGPGTKDVESSVLSEQELAVRLHVPEFMLEGLEGDERSWHIKINGVDYEVQEGKLRLVDT